MCPAETLTIGASGYPGYISARSGANTSSHPSAPRISRSASSVRG